MDNFITTAIIGTGQQSKPDLSTGTPVDQLATHLPNLETERKLLLSAGSLAVYRQAGKTLQTHENAITPAPTEQLPICSSHVAHQIEQFLQGDRADLLPEALSLLQHANRRLPYNLLPQALNYGKSNKELRSALLPVLGERGFWLSQFNDDWAWATQGRAVSGEALPADAETIWQEGTLEQRCTILRLLRATDAARAREWLSKVWKQEKAEARQSLLDTFTVGISKADEPFLENALDDRSEYVRSLARTLLGRIPDTAFSQRMLAYADEILHFDKSTKKGSSPFLITLPAPIPQEWRRDGVVADRKKTSEIVQHVLSYVPPSHWEEHFSASPKTLIAAAQKDEDREMLLSGWTDAAQLFSAQNWLPPLFDFWRSQEKKRNSYYRSHRNFSDLLKSMSLDDAEQKLLDVFNDLSTYYAYQFVDIAATVLPSPWRDPFARTILHTLKDFLGTPKQRNYAYSWSALINLAGTALPESCFENALSGWEHKDEQENSGLLGEVAALTQKIMIRQMLIQETR